MRPRAPRVLLIIKVRDMCNSRAAAAAERVPPARLPSWPGIAARALCVGALLALSGCGSEPLNPKGAIGAQEKHLIVLATAIMLAVAIPVIVMTLYFAWRYRSSNAGANYAPKWSHSTAIEVVIWTIPCVIVAFLDVLIWNTTHRLDPYQPLASKVAPVRVHVVALNWKWLFVYPDYGVASRRPRPRPRT